jgi:hypothetical protein
MELISDENERQIDENDVVSTETKLVSTRNERTAQQSNPVASNAHQRGKRRGLWSAYLATFRPERADHFRSALSGRHSEKDFA